MIIVMSAQFFQFLMIRRIIHLFKRTREERAFTDVNDIERAEAEEDVYEKRFYNGRWWVLVVTGFVYLGVGIYASMNPAEQVYFKLWIPISFFIFVGSVAYYIYNYYLDKHLHKFE